MAEHHEGPVGGLHHVTALSSDPARNVAFYTRLLGLRLVKRTVNFDDPGTWHLYYGDDAGRPGTILTFFPYPGLAAGRHGSGQAVEVAFAIPPAGLGFWTHRLMASGITFEGPFRRSSETVLRLRDPDGLQIELVTAPSAADRPPWTVEDIPAESAIRGFHSITLWEEGYDRTAALLTDMLGYKLIEQDENRFRFIAVDRTGAPGAIVDIRCTPNFWPGALGAGTVHHIAFRAPDNAVQDRLHHELTAKGFNVSPALDRQYFRSIYFREPGGVLFEVATDPPGFAVDEAPDALGTTLKLPRWLEPRRAEIAAALPSLERGAAEQAPETAP